LANFADLVREKLGAGHITDLWKGHLASEGVADGTHNEDAFLIAAGHTDGAILDRRRAYLESLP